MDIIGRLMTLVYSSAELADIEFVSFCTADKMLFPPVGTTAAFGMKNENEGCLIGGTPVVSSSVEMAVITAEANGGEFCREQARRICTEIMELDNGELISSLRVFPAVYDKTIGGWKTVVEFGIRELSR